VRMKSASRSIFKFQTLVRTEISMRNNLSSGPFGVASDAQYNSLPASTADFYIEKEFPEREFRVNGAHLAFNKLNKKDMDMKLGLDGLPPVEANEKRELRIPVPF
jgi:hypothetical protein